MEHIIATLIKNIGGIVLKAENLLSTTDFNKSLCWIPQVKTNNTQSALTGDHAVCLIRTNFYFCIVFIYCLSAKKPNAILKQWT